MGGRLRAPGRDPPRPGNPQDCREVACFGHQRAIAAPAAETTLTEAPIDAAIRASGTLRTASERGPFDQLAMAVDPVAAMERACGMSGRNGRDQRRTTPRPTIRCQVQRGHLSTRETPLLPATRHTLSRIRVLRGGHEPGTSALPLIEVLSTPSHTHADASCDGVGSRPAPSDTRQTLMETESGRPSPATEDPAAARTPLTLAIPRAIGRRPSCRSRLCFPTGSTERSAAGARSSTRPAPRRRRRAGRDRKCRRSRLGRVRHR